MPIIDFVHNVKLDMQNLCDNMLLLLWFSNCINYLDACGLNWWESFVSGIFTVELSISLVMFMHSSVHMLQLQNWSHLHYVWYCGILSALASLVWNQTVSVLGILYDQTYSGFGGLEVACWPLVPKFAGSIPAEAVGFFRAKKSSARLPSEGK